MLELSCRYRKQKTFLCCGKYRDSGSSIFSSFSTVFAVLILCEVFGMMEADKIVPDANVLVVIFQALVDSRDHNRAKQLLRKEVIEHKFTFYSLPQTLQLSLKKLLRQS